MISLFIPGKPVPQGSGKAITSRSTNRAIFLHSNREQLKGFRAAVKAAVEKAGVTEPITGPVRVRCDFFLPRPKAHYRANGSRLRIDAPVFPTTRPDVDKLLRAVNDALTEAGAWKDDSQVVLLNGAKFYASSEGELGTVIEIGEL
jgi:crossover junction endodeoxyribonuclease RusA